MLTTTCLGAYHAICFEDFPVETKKTFPANIPVDTRKFFFAYEETPGKHFTWQYIWNPGKRVFPANISDET